MCTIFKVKRWKKYTEYKFANGKEGAPSEVFLSIRNNKSVNKPTLLPSFFLSLFFELFLQVVMTAIMMRRWCRRIKRRENM